MNKNIKILIVEDEVLTAKMIQAELRRSGYRVCQHVTTGEEAVSAVAQEPVDIILMDIGLPGKINGIEAAKQIQALVKSEVVFMTGYPDKDMMDMAMSLNPLGYFIKPLNMYDIFNTFNQLIG